MMCTDFSLVFADESEALAKLASYLEGGKLPAYSLGAFFDEIGVALAPTGAVETDEEGEVA